MKLIIISNRLPVKIVDDNGAHKITRSDGGLATGLNSLTTSDDKHWIGWPGMYLEEGEEKKKINQELESYKYHPVYLTPEQIENYYEGYSNSILWPLCHYFNTNVEYNNEYWEAYKQVNALFCDAAMQIIEPGDTVWVQDYQLMLLPAMLRERIFDVSIGYFLHIPFPSYELFRCLPERAEILHGLLGADLVAFHTHSYMRHFISAVYRVLGLDCTMDEIQLDRRIVEVDAFPMGINYEQYYDAILQPEVREKANELKTILGEQKLMISVDRLDYSKGILLRLKSFDEFLANHPEYHEKVSFVMVVSPSRDTVEKYADLKTEIDQMVGAINGKYSTLEWMPVHYFYRSFPFEEVTALYYIADIALVTPLRDGMNLVAKEYLAAKRDRPGVLILSEMAGAANELSDAIIVNPTDTKEIENAIVEALEMPEEEQLKSLQAMQEIISVQTVQQWASDFIDELKGVKYKNEVLQHKLVENNNFHLIKQAYDKAQKRLILLDYDGTLVGFNRNPQRTVPTPQLIDLLTRLSGDPKNYVVISSGRDLTTLDQWLGNLPIGLAAEHGAFYKEDGQWHRNAEDAPWNDEIVRIIRQIIRKTPRSRLEIKKTALVWHYREVDAWLAELRVNQLINALIGPTSQLNLQIMKGNKIIEIKSSAYSKGTEA
ncbi:MAG: bifunctional alpha,alpha-trehalose-phosphate synthase (UDP-forming)/trehalose-phosphatase, partial [Tannerellaceae bacterium]|nr:bifunctional alpha,alpha-trehalose-phosphate synthase (UDP-forming)/trehalose-phosphatase [Tannerellaceae bacterium]